MTLTLESLVVSEARVATTARRARVLAITSELPWPLNTGGHIRTFHLLRALAEQFDVRLLTVVEEQDVAHLEQLRNVGIEVCGAVVGPRRSWSEAARVTSSAMRGEPYVMYRRHDRGELRRLVEHEIARETPDVVYFDHLDPFVFRPLIPAGVRLIADLHNVYSRLTERVADEHRGPKRIFLRREAKLLAQIEQRVTLAADVVMTVSSEEQNTFRGLGGRDVRLVPNGVDCRAYAHLPIGRNVFQNTCSPGPCGLVDLVTIENQPTHKGSGYSADAMYCDFAPTLLYLGAMSWQPNAKAAEFLAREILPAVRQRFPNARLQLVGRNPGADVLALRQLPGVEVAANVPDVGVYLAQATLLAVPLDSGGGTRLKILEAFAAGLPVVSTPIGCEGIDATAGEHLWIAPRESFADAICDALADPEASRCLAENARQLAWNRYDWSAIGREACAAVRAVTDPSGKPIANCNLTHDVNRHSQTNADLKQTPDPFVLHVRVVTGTGGGPEKTILNSPRFLKPLGYDCACAYLHPPGDPGFEVLRQRASELDAELISVPDRGATDWRVVRQLLRICRERNVAVWHGHDYKSNALGLLLRKFHTMALVSTVHGWIVPSRKLAAYRAVDLACLRHYDEVICVSDALLDECLAARVPLERCRVIENAIDLTKYSDLPDRAAARRSLGLPEQGNVVVSVGRLSPEKGFDVLIRAVDQLLESGCDVRLLIAGEGTERSALESLISELHREDRIQLLGHQPDPRTIYAAADAFVLSSHREGLPNVLLEAFACGLPVVATAVGGVPRVIADEHNGLLVPPGDVNGLTVTLSRLLHNDALQQQLATAARRTLSERCRFEARMRKVVGVYDEVLATQSSRIRNVVSAFGPKGQVSSAQGNALGSRSTEVPSPERAKLFAERVSPLQGFDHGAPTHQGRCPGLSSAGPSGQTADLQPTPVVTVTAQPRGWHEYLAAHGYAGFQQSPQWSQALSHGLEHQSFFLQATQGQRLVGVLPLQLVESRLFGRFLVSLPYVNTAGVVADSDVAAMALVDRAMELADALDVKHLELRHERAIEHPKLVNGVTDKVHMRLPLPSTSEELWDGIKAKVRNQIRKAQKTDGFSVHWGREELLGEFYEIFCHNMRDLGTPPFSRQLFAEILAAFPRHCSPGPCGLDDSQNKDESTEPQGLGLQTAAAEICVVRLHGRAVASGLLVHGPGTTQVPSASSLREFNSSNANMLLYWNLLTRAIERGQREFDFGRSTRGGGTFKFKAQWGAIEHPAVWQHYVRHGSAGDMRPSNGKFQKLIQIWQRLPVWVTRLIGPAIVRGIP